MLILKLQFKLLDWQISLMSRKLEFKTNLIARLQLSKRKDEVALMGAIWQFQELGQKIERLEELNARAKQARAIA
jgi:hypothetical protein